MRSVVLWLWVFAVTLPANVGCGKRSSWTETATEVSGTVTYQGKQFSGGMVVFDSRAAGAGGSADIGPTGEYKTSFAVKPGKYEVIVRGPPPPPPVPDPNWVSKPTPSKPIPKKYLDPRTSGLQVELKTGEKNSFNIDLRP